MSQDDLFPTDSGQPLSASPNSDPNPSRATAPLAARMRPRDLEDFVGQEHLLGAGKLLRRAIEADRIASLILYGPPGTGKTSLAQIIAQRTASHFVRLSAVESNVAEIRRTLASAGNRQKNTGHSTLLFIDEIHRFSRSQQDVLLPDVESGVVRLIGATTENPFFFVNSPLVSRSQVFELRPLSPSDLRSILEHALTDRERGLGERAVRANTDALDHLAKVANGDARKALNSLELAVLTSAADETGSVLVDLAVAEECIQKTAVVYDGDGDAHYDTISAFIKSMRGSDPDATLYWLAKMIHAGEDPRFIARRIVIHAAEDVGLADPIALVLANAAFQASEFIGWPEARIPLAEAALYIATAPKSNSTLLGIDAALKDVREGRTLPVPEHLKDSHYQGAKRLGHGEGYLYAHDYPGHIVAQDYLTEKRRYYTPSDQGQEIRIKETLDRWRKQLEFNHSPQNRDDIENG